MCVKLFTPHSLTTSQAVNPITPYIHAIRLVIFHSFVGHLLIYRSNLLYIFGLISFTDPAAIFASSSKSSMRATARPWACSTNGSLGPASVQEAGRKAVW